MPTAEQVDPRKREGQEFWDSNPCGGSWPTYASFLEWIRRTEPYAYDVVDRYHWEGKEVLDVGCGQGILLNYLPSLGASVTGVDMSRESIRRALNGARELGHADRVRAFEADAERLPFPDDSFDAAVSFGVLHHTPDTAAAVREIWRVLRPGGAALVMLYRSGNPKWWATRLLRGGAHLADRVTGQPSYLANRLRAAQHEGDARGTALLELFGCPILKAFSNRSALQMFQPFSEARVSNHQPGFARLADIASVLRPAQRRLEWIDRATRERWGFYQVIEARK